MQKQTFEVKSKQRKVGEVTVPFYDTLDEAVQNEGEEKVLELFNAQNKTNHMNAARAAAQPQTSKKQLRNLAMSELTVEQWQSVAGDPQAIEQLIESKAEEIKQRLEAQAAVQSEDDDEEEDDD